MESDADNDGYRGYGHGVTGPFLVLAVLAAGPQHAYAIRRTIQQLVGGDFGTSSLYKAVNELHRYGLIERGPEEHAGGRRRIPLTITPAGRQQLDQWAAVARRALTHADVLADTSHHGGAR